MRKLIFFFPFILYAGILSELKQKEMDIDSLKSVKDSIETKRSWINPVTLKYSYSKSNTGNITSKTHLYTISVNQPIFKSGAIYYSIKYGDLSKNYNLKQIELKKRELIKRAYDLVYDYRISKINEKVLELKIENARIDVKRKKEAFLSGTGDSSLLDNAILNLNNLKLSLEDIKQNELQLKYSFSNLSDLDIKKVKLPDLILISKNKYLNEHLELKSQKLYEKIKNSLYKMQVGNQLFTVSLKGSINYQKIKTDLSVSKENYYTAGMSVSLPLDVNSKVKIEKAKLDYLKSKYLLKDKKREIINEYKKNLAQIFSLKKKLKIYDENIKIYENLIYSTEESIKAGNATYLDLEVLENSKKAAVLNKEIIKLQIQKKLLNLYYKLVSFSNR